MRLLSVCLTSFLFACSSDKSITTVNASPEATITSHSDGDEVLEGFIGNLRGQVSDSNHSSEELEAAWYYGDDVICDWEAPDSGGATSCDVLFELDETIIRLEVRDPDGAGAFDDVTLSIEATDAPVVCTATAARRPATIISGFVYFYPNNR